MQIEDLSNCLKTGIESFTTTNKEIYAEALKVSDDASNKIAVKFKADDVKKFMESIRHEEIVLKFVYGFEISETNYKNIASDERVRDVEYDRYPIQKRDKNDNIVDVIMIRNKTNVLSEKINLVAMIESMDIPNKQNVLEILTKYETAYQDVIKAPDSLTAGELKELKAVLSSAKKSWDSVKPVALDELLKEVNESEKAFNEDYRSQKQLLAKVKNIAKNNLDTLLLKEIQEAQSKRVAIASDLRAKFANKLTNDKNGKTKGIKY